LAYDPYIYHYMRSFGLPQSYYGTYLTELTPPHLKRYRAKTIPATSDDPTNPHPSRLPWVTNNVLVLSCQYLRKDDSTGNAILPLRLAQHRAEVTRQRLLDAPIGRARAGAARAHLHAQARLLAALVTEWESHQIPTDIRMPAPVTVERSDHRRKIAEERRQRKIENRQRKMLEVEWQHIKEKYASIRKDYDIARDTHRLARYTSTPTPVVTAARQKRQRLLAQKRKIHREYATVKAKLRRFNIKHGLIHLPTS
jgi:hypothetical protein